MPEFPAECDRCGQLLRSGISVTHSVGISVSNNTVRCRCGGTGRTVEGIYDADGNSFMPVRASQADRRLLARAGLLQTELTVMTQLNPAVQPQLADLLQSLLNEQKAAAQSRELTNELLEQLILTRAPDAAPLILRLLRDSATAQVIGLVALLVTVLTLVLSS